MDTLDADAPELPGVLRALRDDTGPDVVVLADEALVRAEAELAAAGWVARGGSWARFAGGRGRRLDLVGAAALRGLVPLGQEPLALQDALLLRALAAPGRGPAVLPGHRTALHGRTAQQPAAWLQAYERARPLGLGRRVVALQDAYETGLPLGTPPGTAAAQHDAEVVALSGLDGAGKTTQAHLLAVALHDVGRDVAVEWSRLGVSPALERLTAPARRVKALVRRSGETAQAPAGEPATDPAAFGALRTARRSPLVDAPWSVAVAAAEVQDALHRQRRHAAAGRVVIRDRYVLDSLVHVADRYGSGAATAAARSLLRQRTPAPTAALLLDLPPEQALARKPAEWSLADLERHARSYAEIADELGVERVDARLPVTELAAVIAARVWQRLR